MKNFLKKAADRIPVPDGAVTACHWLKKNYLGCFISLAILLGIFGVVWARGDLSPPRIAFAHADAKAMAQGIFGGMKDKLGEMARGIEAALAENAKTNAEVSAVKGRVTKIEQAPTMTADDLQREIKKLMDTIQLKIDQKVPMSEYQNDKKLLTEKVSMLQSIMNSVVGKANAQPAPAAQAPPAPAEQVDLVRFEQVRQQCPTYMEKYFSQKDALPKETVALKLNEKTPKQFESALNDCRHKEANLQYPPPAKTPRDLKFYEKERLALNRVPKCSFGVFSKEKGKCI